MNFFDTEPNKSRIVLLLLLLASLAFNYILWQDNKFLMFRHQLMEHKFIEDVIGYDYCQCPIDKEAQ